MAVLGSTLPPANENFAVFWGSNPWLGNNVSGIFEFRISRSCLLALSCLQSAGEGQDLPIGCIPSHPRQMAARAAMDVFGQSQSHMREEEEAPPPFSSSDLVLGEGGTTVRPSSAVPGRFLKPHVWPRPPGQYAAASVPVHARARAGGSWRRWLHPLAWTPCVGRGGGTSYKELDRREAARHPK